MKKSEYIEKLKHLVACKAHKLTIKQLKQLIAKYA